MDALSIAAQILVGISLAACCGLRAFLPPFVLDKTGKLLPGLATAFGGTLDASGDGLVQASTPVWWLAAAVMTVAYALCMTVIGLPIGFVMFDWVPGILTLRRAEGV